MVCSVIVADLMDDLGKRFAAASSVVNSIKSILSVNF